MEKLKISRQIMKNEEIAQEHDKQLAKALNDMRKETFLCNCNIVLKSRKRKHSTQVHFPVVAAMSEYCKLNSEYKNGRRTITIRETFGRSCEMDWVALEHCIEFMYIGRTEITNDTAEAITRLSHKLKLKPLENLGLEAMHGNLTTFEHCCALHIVAGYCEREEYQKEAIKEWISLNLQQKSLSDGRCPENMWQSVADLALKSRDFRNKCNKMNVLEVAEIRKADCKFLLEHVMTNDYVGKDYKIAKYVFQIISEKIHEQPLNLTTKNLYTVKDFSEKYDRKDEFCLNEELEKFMIKNFDSLAQEHRFLEMKEYEFSSILICPELAISERTKFYSIVKWVNHEPNRDEHFPELFWKIKLRKLSRNDLNEIRKNPLVKNNLTVKSSVDDILLDENYKEPQQETTEELLVPTHTLENSNTCAQLQSLTNVPENSSTCAESSLPDGNAGSSSSKKSSSAYSFFSTASLKEDLIPVNTSDDSGVNDD